MANLQGKQINNTYNGLIKTSDEAAIDGTLKNLQDGEGNDLPLQVSTTGVNFTGTVTGVPAGAQGAQGDIGPQGPTGPQGADGVQGTTGAQGADGVQGATGPQGATGAAGVQGPTGPQGADGVVQSIVAGTNVTVDSSDPANPIVSSTGGGGGGFTPLSAISNQNYGMQWSFYDPAGGPGAYGRRIIGYSVYLPAGDYDQFSHWVHTAATTAGSVYDLAVYNVDTTVWPSNAACSFKPTTMVTNALATGIDATSTGQRLITLASPFTSAGDWYFFGFRFDNGVDAQLEGKYVGVDANAEVSHFISPSIGGPTPYQYAATELDTDALILGASSGPYTSMPTDLTSEPSIGNTSYRIAFSAVAQ